MDPKVDGGKWYQLKDTAIKQVQTRTRSPIQIPTVGWNSFQMLNIPNMFNYGHIYNYIVESICDYSTKTEDRDDSSSGDIIMNMYQ